MVHGTLRKMSVLVALVVMAVPALVACSFSDDEMLVATLAWPEGGRLYYVLEPAAEGFSELWSRGRDGGEQLVSLADTAQCEQARPMSVYSVGLSRVGVARECRGEGIEIGELDAASERLETLGTVSFQSDLDVRWSANGDAVAAVCSRVVPIGLGGHNIDGLPSRPGPFQCDSKARAIDPAFIGDGHSLVYLESQNAVTGMDGAHNYTSGSVDLTVFPA